MKARTISVVIPCLNVAGTIARLVDSLRRQELPPGWRLEVIAVDNGSTDGTASRLAALDARIIHEPRPGASAARNAGVRAASGEIIVFLDADTRAADPHLLAEHLRTLDSDPETGIAGGAITHDPEQRSWLAFAENATGLFNWHENLCPRDLTYQPAGNMAFRKALFERVGPLDESLLTLEDFDWSRRVLQAGGRILFNPRARVYIRGREHLGAILRKFYRWGLNVRSVYIPGRPRQVWLFRNHPILFALNAPIRIVNETWVTVKRWAGVHPFKTLALIPLFALYRSAWALGIVAGAREALRADEASSRGCGCCKEAL